MILLKLLVIFHSFFISLLFSICVAKFRSCNPIIAYFV